MSQEQEFAKRLESLKRLAKEQGNCVSTAITAANIPTMIIFFVDFIFFSFFRFLKSALLFPRHPFGYERFPQ